MTGPLDVLVTGVAGLIGTALTRIASAAGHQVTGLALPDCDVSRPGWTDGIRAPRADVVFHLAQSRRFRDGLAGAPDVFSVNVASTAALLQWACNHGVRRFVLASSGSVYARSEGRVTESDPTAAINTYTGSKLAAEAIASGYQGELEVVIVRPFTVYGPGQQAMIVPRLISSIRAGEPISLPGGEGMVLTPTYVDDCAEAMWRLATAAPAERRLVVNIAGPECCSVRAMATMVGTQLGVTPILREEPGPRPVVAGSGHLCERLTGVTFRTFVEGLRETVRLER